MKCRYSRDNPGLDCGKSESERDADCPYCAYRADEDPAALAQHILKGNKRQREYDYTDIEDRLRLKLDGLKDRLKDLTGPELEELECDLDACLRVAKLFTARKQPTDDESPAPTVSGHARRTAPHEGFKGTETTPIPLGGSETGSATILEIIVETMEFKSLIAIADILGISHNYGEWLDDDWHDKENDLRVAVTEAMERIGK